MSEKRLFGYVTKSKQIIGHDSWLSSSFAGGTSDKSDPTLDSYNNGLVQPPISIDSLTNVLRINTHHAACCHVKANDAAGSNYDLRPTKPNPAKSQKKRATEFLKNLDIPINETLRKVLFDYESIGYGAIEVVREQDNMDRPIDQLLHLPAHNLRVHESRKKYSQKRGNKTKWFKDIESDFEVNVHTGAERDTLRPASRGNEIIFFKKYTYESDFYGTPDIVPAMGAVLGDYEREEYNIQFFTNAGIPAWAIFVTGDYDPGPLTDDLGNEVPEGTAGAKTQFERILESHISQLNENKRSTMIIAIPAGRRDDNSPGKVEVTFQRLSDETKEASFEKYRQSNQDEVLEAHGVPPYRLGIARVGALGGNAAEANDEIYKRSRIDPLQGMVTSRLNRWIFREELDVEDYEFALPEIDTKDEAHDIKIVTPMFAMGSITPNQIIAHFGKKFGIEPVDVNDEDNPLNHHYINGASIELGLQQLGGKDNDQGQRPGDEETEGLGDRASRDTPNSLEAIRQFLESADMDAQTKEQLNGMLSAAGERG